MWYRIISYLFSKYYKRLKSDIPDSILVLFSELNIDLYKIRFKHKVLSVNQVDEVFSLEELSVEQRIAYKNMLVEVNVMEQGEYDINVHLPGLPRVLSKDKTKYWNNGKSIVNHKPSNEPIAIMGLDFNERITLIVFKGKDEVILQGSYRSEELARIHLKQYYPEVKRLFYTPELKSYLQEQADGISHQGQS